MTPRAVVRSRTWPATLPVLNAVGFEFAHQDLHDVFKLVSSWVYRSITVGHPRATRTFKTLPFQLDTQVVKPRAKKLAHTSGHTAWSTERERERERE